MRENNNDHMQDFVRENYNDLNLYAFGIIHSVGEKLKVGGLIYSHIMKLASP